MQPIERAGYVREREQVIERDDLHEGSNYVSFSDHHDPESYMLTLRKQSFQHVIEHENC